MVMRSLQCLAKLGYILGDEGGGAVIGGSWWRECSRSSCRHSDRELSGLIPFTPAEILDNVYNMPSRTGSGTVYQVHL